MIEKRDAQKRWNDPSFQREVLSLVAMLKAGCPVLSGVDLAGIAIGLAGPISDLWQANLYRARLSAVDLGFSRLACSLNEGEFKHVRFAGSDFDRCLVRKAVLEDCDFTGAKLVARMDDSLFRRCDFSGAEFGIGRAGHEYGGRRVGFNFCNFTKAVFKHVEFRASEFLNCTFDGVRFIQCDIRGMKVDGGSPPGPAQFEGMQAPAWCA